MKRKIIFFGVMSILSIVLFYGWNTLKDRQEKVISIEKIKDVQLTLTNNKLTLNSNVEALLKLDKFKQFDHSYIIQNKETIYIALSETISMTSKENTKVKESFASTMNYSDDFEIKKVYIVSGSEILLGGADPEKYDQKKLVWSIKE